MRQNNRSKESNRGWQGLVSVLCLLCGLLLVCYPWISNRHNEKMAAAEIRVCKTDIQQMDEQETKRQWEAAGAYNRSLQEQQVEIEDAFSEKSKSAQGKMDSDDLFYKKRNGILGEIEIPCIRVRLPVYEGTSAEILDKGIGHLRGSSLPIGGQGTHAVLTGHTGLNKARLFTDLIQMQKGDLFFLHVLDQTLAYRVEQIFTVLPEDTKKLRIEKEEDLVTLVTCTPYGINDHRLLVRGKRIAYTESAYAKEQQKSRHTPSLWMRSYISACALGCLFLLCGGWLVHMVHRLCRKRRP